MCDLKNDFYVQLLNSITENDILDQAGQVLSALRAKGLKLAIGSSSKNTRKILDQIGLLDDFDAIADGTDITRSKPDPEVFLCAAGKLGVRPACCVVVEDAVSGIQAAKAAGMTGCAVGDAKSSPLADLRLDSLQQLPELLNG